MPLDADDCEKVVLGLAILRIGTISKSSPRAPRLLSVTESIVLPPRPRGVQMSNISKFSIHEWMVPPVLLPIFFALLIAAALFSGSCARQASDVSSGQWLVRPNEGSQIVVSF